MFGSVQPSPAALIRAAFYFSNLLVHNEREYHPLGDTLFHGGLEEIRTPDPRNANAMRSQLRYKPVSRLIILPAKKLVKKKEASDRGLFTFLTE